LHLILPPVTTCLGRPHGRYRGYLTGTLFSGEPAPKSAVSVWPLLVPRIRGGCTPYIFPRTSSSERHPPWPSRLPANRQYLERPGANDGDDDDFVLPRAVTASPLPASVLLSIAPHGEHYKVSAFSGRVELSRQTLCTTSPVVFSTRFIPWSHQCSPDLLGLLHLPPSSPRAAASRCFIAPLPIRPLVSSPVIRRQHRPTTTASLAISTTTLPQQFPEAPARTDMNLLTAPAI